MRSVFFIFCISISFSLIGQELNTDSIKPTIKPQSKKGPRTASILSAIIPGAGQVYNRKYWKVPIIYAGLGGLSYVFLNSQKEYTYYRTNLINEADGDANTINDSGYDQSQLQVEKLRFRKYRDLSAFGLIAVYAINIIDANVDAHLKSFDVSDDLSLQFKPKPFLLTSGGLTCGAGISLKLNFK